MEACPLGLHDGSEFREVIREGLGNAAGIVDRHRHIAQGRQRKAHGHTVVVIGIDGDAGSQASRWREKQ